VDNYYGSVWAPVGSIPSMCCVVYLVGTVKFLVITTNSGCYKKWFVEGAGCHYVSYLHVSSPYLICSVSWCDSQVSVDGSLERYCCRSVGM